MPEIIPGEQGVIEVARHPDAFTVVTGIVGCAGLKPTVAAIEAGKDIALANQETSAPRAMTATLLLSRQRHVYLSREGFVSCNLCLHYNFEIDRMWSDCSYDLALIVWVDYIWSLHSSGGDLVLSMTPSLASLATASNPIHRLYVDPSNGLCYEEPDCTEYDEFPGYYPSDHEDNSSNCLSELEL
ncbi:hypothetical protein CFC21_084660 [Triticum aestivum]|uniref:1-deoxy-D-xylulose 5-phosphate reductoisomerase N-terminal domain-containing protein n=3 Tax=Triticum TaxID=4564 RepID=A0A9R1B3A7_TRITD|nr:hypothetical protein CFC21_084660 [Triticum aestivum]VAI49902.1 unnamed protein product [Triticum turgidum subsp. durum]